MKQLQIQKNEAGQRLDKYLKKLLPQADSSFIYKMLRKKNIVLNGKKAEGRVHLVSGDAVTLYLSDETFEKFSIDSISESIPENIRKMMPDIQVLFEDADILMIDKPAGVLSQKASADDLSANEWIIRYLLDTGAVTRQTLQTFRPSVCNRLDRNTSGILIAGKTLHGLQMMSAQLKTRSIKKYYRCIVTGILMEGRHLKGTLRKDKRKNKVEIYQPGHAGDAQKKSAGADDGLYEIETEYRPVGYGKDCTMLEVHLITGRSHQIRAHLAACGHPVAGDPKYGDPEWNKRHCAGTGIHHQMLHAYRVVLENGLEVVAPLPEYFSYFGIQENAYANMEFPWSARFNAGRIY